MINRVLREELRLGDAVTAYDLRRAVVDFYMSGDFTDAERTGAPPAGGGSDSVRPAAGARLPRAVRPAAAAAS
jgi:hypothetical protein